MYEDEVIGLRAALAVAGRERDEAREDAHYAHGVAKLALQHRDRAEEALAAVEKELVKLLTFIDRETP